MFCSFAPIASVFFSLLTFDVSLCIGDECRKTRQKFRNQVIESQTIFIFQKQRGHPGSNQAPLDLQSNALPLSYAPINNFTDILLPNRQRRRKRHWFLSSERSYSMVISFYLFILVSQRLPVYDFGQVHLTVWSLAMEQGALLKHGFVPHARI